VFGVVVFDDKIWIIGGWNIERMYNDVWSSTDGINWVCVTDHAPWSERIQNPVVAFDGKIWTFGGFDSSGMETDDVWCSSDGKNWRKYCATSTWPRRWGHASVVFNDRVWVIGGIDDFPPGPWEWYNDVWYLETGKR
jgi:hypothetical protein